MMPATPAPYDPETRSLRWFVAQYTSGACSGCGTPIHEGEEIAYSGNQEEGQYLVRRECCDAPDVYVSESSTRPSRVKVMPTGKTKRDVCSRCFIIHTAAQGDECE
jgi:hypothetical protein